MKSRADEMRRIMDFKHNIRNVSIIAHAGHGIKSSYPLVALFLLVACRIIGSTGDGR